MKGIVEIRCLVFAANSETTGRLMCVDVYVPVEDGEVFDFRGMRLDWFRLQVRINIWSR